MCWLAVKASHSTGLSHLQGRQANSLTLCVPLSPFIERQRQKAEHEKKKKKKKLQENMLQLKKKQALQQTLLQLKAQAAFVL